MAKHRIGKLNNKILVSGLKKEQLLNQLGKNEIAVTNNNDGTINLLTRNKLLSGGLDKKEKVEFGYFQLTDSSSGNLSSTLFVTPDSFDTCVYDGEEHDVLVLISGLSRSLAAGVHTIIPKSNQESFKGIPLSPIIDDLGISILKQEEYTVILNNYNSVWFLPLRINALPKNNNMGIGIKSPIYKTKKYSLATDTTTDESCPIVSVYNKNGTLYKEYDSVMVFSARNSTELQAIINKYK